MKNEIRRKRAGKPVAKAQMRDADTRLPKANIEKNRLWRPEEERDALVPR